MTVAVDPSEAGTQNPSAALADNWPVIIAAICVVAAESLLVFLAQGRSFPLFAIGLTHVVIIAAILATGWFSKQSRDREAFLTLGAWTAIAGPFGAAFIPFILIGARHGQNRPAPDYEALFCDEAECPERTRVQSLVDAIKDNRLNMDAPVGLRSFRACMESGDQRQKLNVLRAVGADYGPDIAPILQAAIVSDDAVIRVMASTVLAKINKTENVFLLEYADNKTDAETTNVRRLPSPDGANDLSSNNTPQTRTNPFTQTRSSKAVSLAPSPEKAAEKP